MQTIIKKGQMVMNKYIEQVNKGKEPKVVILEMYQEIESLKGQLVCKSNEYQKEFIKFENKIDELEKENHVLRVNGEMYE